MFQGAYWEQTLLWKDGDEVPVDLTGYTARMHVRRTVDEAGTPIISLTTENARIVLGLVEETPGVPLYNILLKIAAADTTSLPATPADRKWRYDLELVPAGGQVRRLLMGKLAVSLEVTR